jgi:hypothetical protein
LTIGQGKGRIVGTSEYLTKGIELFEYYSEDKKERSAVIMISYFKEAEDYTLCPCGGKHVPIDTTMSNMRTIIT